MKKWLSLYLQQSPDTLFKFGQMPINDRVKFRASAGWDTKVTLQIQVILLRHPNYPFFQPGTNYQNEVITLRVREYFNSVLFG